MNATIFNIQKFSLHDGDGIRTCIFFKNCNLRCKWCANPECYIPNQTLCDEKIYTADALLQEVLKDRLFYDKSGGGVTLTGGEIFLQFPFIKYFCRQLKLHKIHIVAETSGNAEESLFFELMELVDFLYIDCKHYNPNMHKQGTGTDNRKILKNMGHLASSSLPYCIRIPVIPHYNDSVSDAENFCTLFREIGIQNVELLPFHQLGESKYQKLCLPYSYAGVSQLHKEDLQEYKQVFIRHGFHTVLK